MQKKRTKSKHNSLARKIVSMTVFLNALFLVIVIAILAFVYKDNLDNTQASRMESEITNTTGSVEAFLRDATFDIDTLAEEASVINYLKYLNNGGSPVITAVDDPNYILYNNFKNEFDSLYQFSYEGVYNFIFLATDVACSTGLDGCFIGTDDQMSDASWALHDRPWYTDLGLSDFVITSPYLDSLSGEQTISFVSTVYDSTEIIGYVGIDVLISALPNVFIAYDYYTGDQAKSFALFEQKDSITVLHVSDIALSAYELASGTTIPTQDALYGFAGAGMAQVIENIDTSSSSVNLNIFGKHYLVAYSDIPDADWLVAIFVEATPGFTLELTFLIFLSGILFLMFLVSLILSKNIHKTLSPIDDILNSIEEIKKGNYNIHVRVKENNELRHVAEALNIMSSEIGKQVELVYQSFVFDTLTGLKNRKASHQEIDEYMRKETEKVAVCLLEVGNLKSINVTKGQNVSDELIKGIANRLRKSITNMDYIYANGGNEFVFLVPNVKSLERVEYEINKVFESFSEPIDISGLKVEVTLRAGIGIYPSDGRNVVDLIKRCDVALYKARETQGSKFVFYNDQLTKEVSYKAQLSEQLALAIRNEQLYLKYQPLIDSKNEIYGFEALVRWKSPTLGEISPQIFVANAEESHLIIPIGNWILHQACLAQVEMKKRFNMKFVMSVNVSPVQLMQKDFIDVLKRIIRDTEIDPKFLVLEITEGVLIESSLYLEEIVDYLHEIGARIALDDFGTGYASLTYLKQIPFDNLKIDKSFVDGIFGPKKDHSIIATIVQLVHNLDMTVIAEGVEKRKQYEYLKQISTDVFQGFLFSKPLVFEEASHYVDQFYKVAKNKRIDVFANKDYFE